MRQGDTYRRGLKWRWRTTPLGTWRWRWIPTFAANQLPKSTDPMSIKTLCSPVGGKSEMKRKAKKDDASVNSASRACGLEIIRPTFNPSATGCCVCPWFLSSTGAFNDSGCRMRHKNPPKAFRSFKETVLGIKATWEAGGSRESDDYFPTPRTMQLRHQAAIRALLCPWLRWPTPFLMSFDQRHSIAARLPPVSQSNLWQRGARWTRRATWSVGHPSVLHQPDQLNQPSPLHSKIFKIALQSPHPAEGRIRTYASFLERC